ncbi:MAG: hypothetical protein HYZ71_12405 [Deltaproteobacteria bacterium]|nr:hypothetical protein [Deltaproteobacteria bacterium]
MFSAWLFAALPSDPLVGSAEYYFEKHQFVISMKAWEDLNERYPYNPQILTKLADHQLLLLGRIRARDTLIAAVQSGRLTPEGVEIVTQHLHIINAKFLTDDGQSNYLQARTRLGLKDFAKAETLLNSANRLEDSNTAVLLSLAECQFAQREIERYITTQKSLVAIDPGNWSLRLQLVEALLHESKATQALEFFGTPSGIPKTEGVQLAYGVSLYETGNWDGARTIFNALSQQREIVNPIAWYYLGKLNEMASKSSASYYFNRFIATAHNRKRPSWDPYKVDERVGQLMAKAKAG